MQASNVALDGSPSQLEFEETYQMRANADQILIPSFQPHGLVHKLLCTIGSIPPCELPLCSVKRPAT